jgi:glycosyltransferase involved in cell wall biosynthesis
MRHATAVVMPSLMEGYGLPVGEALAAGAVVAHSRIPVLEEVSAGAAVEFDPGSAVELAGVLRALSADGGLRARLRRRGSARAKALSWDATVAATLATYTEVAR